MLHCPVRVAEALEVRVARGLVAEGDVPVAVQEIDDVPMERGAGLVLPGIDGG